MVRAIERGLSLSDFEIMTVGSIIDYIITYNNINSNDEEEEATKTNTRQATQADFDRF